MQCGSGARGGGATGDGGFVLIGLEGGLAAGLWSGEGPQDEVWAGLVSGQASLCLTGLSRAVSAPAATETADPHL